MAEDHPLAPHTPYAAGKASADLQILAWCRVFGLDVAIMRPFNTYGPRMARDGRVVIEFVTAALVNKPFPVFGDGKQTRSFCFVSDLIDGLIAAMEKGEKGEVYNLGNPQEFTILELAEKVKLLTNTTSEISSIGSLPEDDPIRRCPDIQKAREALGWEPKVSLEEGLKKLIVYLQTIGKPRV